MTDNALPDPFINPEIDLRDFRYMPLDVVQLFNSETWAMADGWGAKACVNLWIRAWHQVPAGSLPNNDNLLKTWSGIDNFDDVRDVALRGFVACNDGRLYHRTICEKAEDAWQNKRANRQRTKAATRARKKKQVLTPGKEKGNDEQRDDNVTEENAQRNDPSHDVRNVVQGKGREGKGIRETTQQRVESEAASGDDCCAAGPDEDLLHPPKFLDKRQPDPAIEYIGIFDTAIVRAYGESLGRPNPHATDLTMARRWLERGVTMQQASDVINGTMAARASKGESPPASLKFFDGFIADKPRAPAKSQTDDGDWSPPETPGQEIINGKTVNDWKAAMIALNDADAWMASEFGPKPGEPGCNVPTDILAEFGLG